MSKLIFSLFMKATSALSGKGIGKIPFIKNFHRFICEIIEPQGIILTTIQGNKMYVDTQDKNVARPLLIHGYYENYTTRLFKKLIKPGYVMVDIGAHIGYYALIAAALVGKGGKVYAFEPEPNTMNLLVRNAKENHYSNIIPIPKAVLNKHGIIKLFVDENSRSTASLSENNIPDQEGSFLEIESVTLDDFFENTVKDDRVDFIKMDAEGAEGLIVDGATRVLQKNNLKILMEFGPGMLKNLGTDPLKLLYQLQNMGFKIRHIDEIGQCLRQVEMVKLIETCENRIGNTGFVDLLLEK